MIECYQPTHITIGEVESSSYEWNPTQIKQEFEQQLLSLGQQIGEPSLTMVNRDIRFVTKEEAIIAKLIVEPFGSFQPYDYLELLREDDSSYAAVET